MAETERLEPRSDRQPSAQAPLQRPTEVHKFGGTSVANAERMFAVARLVAEARDSARVIVVASAMGGVTDGLVGAINAAIKGKTEASLRAIDDIALRHHQTLAALGGPAEGPVPQALDRVADNIRALLRAGAVLRELSVRTCDRILAAGEKLSVPLVATALQRIGVPAIPALADTFLETNARFGESTPIPGVCERMIAAAMAPFLADDIVPVVTGFSGRAPDGATTTLGRGGSDYTATLIADAVGATEVTIWTDVDGVYTSDPRVVPDARPLEQLNFREAAELAYYGAKVLHQRTIIPVAKRGIPVRIRSSFEPSLPGTLVDGHLTPGSHPVKAISAVGQHALLAIEGKGMAGVPGVAARVFEALARDDINVTLISQSSAESSICFAVPVKNACVAEARLKRAFAAELARGDVEEITVRLGVALLAVVGLGMARTPGVAARVFACLGRCRINVLAIAQGSSELNISLAIDEADTVEALRALHPEFGLHRRDTGEDSPRALDLIVLGCGKIGAALAELILERRAHVFERFGLKARIVAVADRSAYLLSPTGIPRDQLALALAAKRAGRRLVDVEGARVSKGGVETKIAMLHEALAYRLCRPLLIDVSDDDDAGETFREAFRLGCDVVTANKTALAGTHADYLSLMDLARQTGRILKAEATVGAGLPIVDTLELLLGTGDRLISAQGSLSGSLAFILNQLEEGVLLSQAVAKAVAQGYTEPDPRIDLTGQDVARKALILGRISGLVGRDAKLRHQGLVTFDDAEPSGLPLSSPAPDIDTLVATLRAHDEPIAAQVKSAREAGKVLRYVARIGEGTVSVGPEAVPGDSALGLLRGTDNMVVFHTERYADRPLVVSGPGAGVDVTAMGVLGDILRISAERG